MTWRKNVSLTIPTTTRAPATTASHAATMPPKRDVTRPGEVETGVRISTATPISAARTVMMMSFCWNVMPHYCAALTGFA